MATVNRLGTYLILEREMLRLEESGSDLAEALRDAMDPIWYQLGPEERKFLNEREIPLQLSELEPIRGSLARAEPLPLRTGFVDAEAIHSASWLRRASRCSSGETSSSTARARGGARGAAPSGSGGAASDHTGHASRLGRGTGHRRGRERPQAGDEGCPGARRRTFRCRPVPGHSNRRCHRRPRKAGRGPSTNRPSAPRHPALRRRERPPRGVEPLHGEPRVECGDSHQPGVRRPTGRTGSDPPRLGRADGVAGRGLMPGSAWRDRGSDRVEGPPPSRIDLAAGHPPRGTRRRGRGGDGPGSKR